MLEQHAPVGSDAAKSVRRATATATCAGLQLARRHIESPCAKATSSSSRSRDWMQLFVGEQQRDVRPCTLGDSPRRSQSRASGDCGAVGAILFAVLFDARPLTEPSESGVSGGGRQSKCARSTACSRWRHVGASSATTATQVVRRFEGCRNFSTGISASNVVKYT